MKRITGAVAVAGILTLTACSGGLLKKHHGDKAPHLCSAPSPLSFDAVICRTARRQTTRRSIAYCPKYR